jgi:AhpC/TSA family
MRHLLIATLVLLLSTLASQAADKAGEGQASPEEQYKSILADYQKAFEACQEALRKAKTEDEREKILAEQYPQARKYGLPLLELAEKNPKSPVAIDALVWVLNYYGADKGQGTPHLKAVALLQRDHIASDRLTDAFIMISGNDNKEDREFLRAVMAKNPYRDMQGRACLGLATNLQRQITIGTFLKMHPEAELEKFLNKEELRELRDAGAGKTAKEIEELYQRAADKYTDVKISTRTSVGEKAIAALFEIRKLKVGEEVPDIEGPDQDGKKFKLSDYKGKVVLLNFWGWGYDSELLHAEWSLVKSMAGRPFTIIGVNVYEEDAKSVKKAMDKEERSWRSFVDPPGDEQEGGPIARKWNVSRTGPLYLLDGKGLIRAKWIIFPDQTTLNEVVEKLVKETEGRLKKE